MPKAYSRKGFRDWLSSLPPDETFCPSDQCPISMFRRTALDHPSDAPHKPWVSNGDSAAYDDDVAEAIDDASVLQWHELTPRHVLELIDDLPN